MLTQADKVHRFKGLVNVFVSMVTHVNPATEGLLRTSGDKRMVETIRKWADKGFTPYLGLFFEHPEVGSSVLKSYFQDDLPFCILRANGHNSAEIAFERYVALAGDLPGTKAVIKSFLTAIMRAPFPENQWFLHWLTYLYLVERAQSELEDNKALSQGSLATVCQMLSMLGISTSPDNILSWNQFMLACLQGIPDHFVALFGTVNPSFEMLRGKLLRKGTQWVNEFTALQAKPGDYHKLATGKQLFEGNLKDFSGFDTLFRGISNGSDSESKRLLQLTFRHAQDLAFHDQCAQKGVGFHMHFLTLLGTIADITPEVQTFVKAARPLLTGQQARLDMQTSLRALEDQPSLTVAYEQKIRPHFALWHTLLASADILPGSHFVVASNINVLHQALHKASEVLSTAKALFLNDPVQQAFENTVKAIFDRQVVLHLAPRDTPVGKGAHPSALERANQISLAPLEVLNEAFRVYQKVVVQVELSPKHRQKMNDACINFFEQARAPQYNLTEGLEQLRLGFELIQRYPKIKQECIQRSAVLSEQRQTDTQIDAFTQDKQGCFNLYALDRLLNFDHRMEDELARDTHWRGVWKQVKLERQAKRNAAGEKAPREFSGIQIKKSFLRWRHGVPCELDNQIPVCAEKLTEGPLMAGRPEPSLKTEWATKIFSPAVAERDKVLAMSGGGEALSCPSSLDTDVDDDGLMESKTIPGRVTPS